MHGPSHMTEAPRIPNVQRRDGAHRIFTEQLNYQGVAVFRDRVKPLPGTLVYAQC